MLWYVGDLHGDTQKLATVDQAAVKAGVTTVIQVGDFGILWETGMRRYFDKRARQGRPGPTWYTCGGNHEHWARWLAAKEAQGNPEQTELCPGVIWVQHGTVLTLEGKRHLFMGGAESTDKAYRIEGKSWWREEVPTRLDWERFAEAWQTGVDVVVSHDAPLCVPVCREYRGSEGSVAWMFTRVQTLFKGEVKEPTFWAFGHHHCPAEWHVDGTHYVCCGWEGERVEVTTGQEPVLRAKYPLPAKGWVRL